MNEKIKSKLKGFYKKTIQERRNIISEHVKDDIIQQLISGGFDDNLLDKFIENAIGAIGIPVGVATNFVINGTEVLVPMAIEEPSVIAAASHGAKIISQAGGFIAKAPKSITVAQIELLDIQKPAEIILQNEKNILALADKSQPELVKLGGGARSIEVRTFKKIANRTVVHLEVDCLDAMGANTVNTMAEKIAPFLEELTGGRSGLKILTNLADKRIAQASCSIPFKYLNKKKITGEDVAKGIAEASSFAADDPYRAATHNKGIFNGVDAVILATGNDWRAVEAGGHAYAAISGQYSPLALWTINDNCLEGVLRMPMAVGVVGGASKLHPAARASLKIMNATSAAALSEIAVCTGLATNMAALMALSTEGIQAGHMKLHKKRLK